MKLISCETFVVGNPPPKAGGRYFIFVKIETDCGITGLGEVYVATFSPDIVAMATVDIFERYFLDQSPFNIESIWRQTYGAGYNLRPDVTLLGVLSGLEIACWDIMGKATNQPVYNLLGGKVHEKLRTYSYVYPKVVENNCYSDAGGNVKAYKDAFANPDLAAERSLDYLDMGFTAVKFDPVGGYSAFDPRQPSLETIELCERFVKQVRDAVGTRADILFGTHGQYTVSGALRMANAIEAADPLWFEEPVPPEMPEEMALVARGTRIPIATGERLCSKYEFQRIFSHKSASIIQPDLGRVGGILEAKKIAAMAEAAYVQLAPHLYCGPVVYAANAHLSCASPNFLILETIENFSGFYADLVKTNHKWEQGYLHLSSDPGLGVELNQALASAHPYDEKELHIEMINRPLYS